MKVEVRTARELGGFSFRLPFRRSAVLEYAQASYVRSPMCSRPSTW